jgi:hypothetical protein
LTRARRAVIHPPVIHTALYSLRCALVALLALSIVSARPAMMLSHAGEGMQHGCGAFMSAHHGATPGSHTDHHCSSTDDGTCCDDCLCACVIGAGMSHSIIALTATYSHPVAVAARFSEVVRERRALALRLPPPIGPPPLTRS